MLLLLDTSTSRLSIGIATEAGELIREFHTEAAEGERGIHDARLAAETERLLNAAGIRAKAISRIGLIIGPGSFTGLRIGLSFAKGVALAAGAALVPLTQHEVIAAEAKYPEDAIVITPGYRDDLFYIADSAAPGTVRLIEQAALASLSAKPMIFHDYLHGKLLLNTSGATFLPVSLRRMAQLTVTHAEPLVQFNDLEPLYVN